MKRADVIAQMKVIDQKYPQVCINPDYAKLFAKTPCNSNDITLAHLADNDKIATDLKSVLLKYRTEVDAISKERNNFGRNDGFPLDRIWFEYLSTTAQAEIDRYNLELYKENINWGEYNQARKNLNMMVAKRNKEIYTQ